MPPIQRRVKACTVVMYHPLRWMLAVARQSVTIVHARGDQFVRRCRAIGYRGRSRSSIRGRVLGAGNPQCTPLRHAYTNNEASLHAYKDKVVTPAVVHTVMDRAASTGSAAPFKKKETAAETYSALAR